MNKEQCNIIMLACSIAFFGAAFVLAKGNAWEHETEISKAFERIAEARLQKTEARVKKFEQKFEQKLNRKLLTHWHEGLKRRVLVEE